MSQPPRRGLSRRQLLGMGGLAAAALALPTALRGALVAQERQDQKFLFVVGAFGGGSIIDSFLPLARSAVQPPGDPDTLIAYPDAVVVQPPGSNLRTIGALPLGDLFVAQYELETFLRRHMEDMTVIPVTNTSVNHVVAQKRAINGAGINGGKTLMEAMAERHGPQLPLPNCNMAAGGYIAPGDDEALDARYRAEIIAAPTLFAASTHGHRGVPGAPPAAAIAQARQLREQLDDASHFGLTFADSPRRQRFLRTRREVLPELEARDLISSLMLLPDDERTPLSRYGLQPLPAAERMKLLTHFPRLLDDPLESQAALAWLLVRYRISCAVTLGPNFQPVFLDQIYGTPLAFDFSHNDHVTAQHVMWGRMLKVIDGLITLLKDTPFDEADPEGGSLWERSLIYVATDFGRDKTRPSGSMSFGTGHHLNNGNLLISPLLKGNRVWGGVDPTTAETFGADGDDNVITFREGHLYSAVAHALDIDFPGRIDMSFVARG